MATIDDILKERAKTHGNFEVTAYTVQTLKAEMRDSPNWAELSLPQKEALDMIMHKMGRLLCGSFTHLDTVRDIIGYAQLLYKAMETDENVTDTKTTRQVFNRGVWEDIED